MRIEVVKLDTEAVVRAGTSVLIVNARFVELHHGGRPETQRWYKFARKSIVLTAAQLESLSDTTKTALRMVLAAKKGRLQPDGSLATPEGRVAVRFSASGAYHVPSVSFKNVGGSDNAPGAAPPADVTRAADQVARHLVAFYGYLRRLSKRARQKNAYPLLQNTGRDAAWVNLTKVPQADGSPRPVHAPLKYDVQAPRAANPVQMLSQIRMYGVTNFVSEGGYGQVWQGVATTRLADMVRRLRYPVPRRPVVPLGTRVAIKFQEARDKQNLERAIRESQAHVRLYKTTVGIVPRLYASGYDHAAGMHVSVMELVTGESLHKYLLKNTLKAAMFVKIERAIVSMWRMGLAHVDLNPGNILVRPDGTVTIIDFGLAEALPKTLVPRSEKNALDQAYQERLLNYLKRTKKMNKFERAALDPHILRWLYWQVADKDRIPRLRQLHGRRPVAAPVKRRRA